jgi:transposase-like protein
MKATGSNSEIAVQDYLSGRFNIQALAVRHGVSSSTIYHWIRRHGAPRRPRGRQRLEKPSPRHHQIIKLSAALPCGEIARRFGVSRQCVHQVLARWAHLLPKGPQSAKLAVVAKSRTRRERKQHIITFRLTTPQTDRVRATLISCGLGNRVSNGAACRAVLLAAIDANNS